MSERGEGSFQGPEFNTQGDSLEIENGFPEEIVKIIKERYEVWTKEFLKKEKEDDLRPLEFIVHTVDSFTEKFQDSEHIDVNNPLETGMMLLALLIEKGAEWGPNKSASVRRVATKLIQNGDITKLDRAYDTLKPILEAPQEEIPPLEMYFVLKHIRRN